MSRLLIAVFLVAASAGGAFPETKKLTEIREEVLALEQVCYHGGFTRQPRFAEEQRERFAAYLDLLAPELKAHGITDESAPKDWDLKVESWTDFDRWKMGLYRLRSVARCERLGLAYTFAVLQLSTLAPTIEIRDFHDILYKSLTPDVVRDRQRAAWALRYLRFIPSDLVPSHCVNFQEEADRRWKFIFSPRKPLGYAIGMCARPMNAHYLDDEVTSGKRVTPVGWSGAFPDPLRFLIPSKIEK